jgi:hypothetical protein
MMVHADGTDGAAALRRRICWPSGLSAIEICRLVIARDHTLARFTPPSWKVVIHELLIDLGTPQPGTLVYGKRLGLVLLSSLTDLSVLLVSIWLRRS